MNRNRYSLGLFAVAVLIACGLSARAGWAQVAGGSNLGTIIDTSGASVPKATVSIKNGGIRSVREVITNVDGLYREPDLSPGKYDIAVAAPGFSQRRSSRPRWPGRRPPNRQGPIALCRRLS